MPRPLLIFSQSGYLIQIVVINLHTWWQTVQIQISWLLQKPTDLDLHCLQNRIYPGSAGQGLNSFSDNLWADIFIIICKKSLTSICMWSLMWIFNPCPAEPGYTLPLQTVQIQISWLLKKPTDLDLHCLSFNRLICINNLNQVIWLAEN